MNDLDALSERLARRFKDVPNFDEDDAMELVETSMNSHKFDKHDDVPTEHVSLILLHAEASAANQIALRTASFFSFVDKDESVDKSMIAGEYRRIATELWREYNRRKEESTSLRGGSVVRYMKRIDR